MYDAGPQKHPAQTWNVESKETHQQTALESSWSPPRLALGSRSVGLRPARVAACMSQLVHIHVGEAGRRAGAATWEAYRNDHGIGANGEPPTAPAGDASILFDEVAAPEGRRWVPRALFVRPGEPPSSRLFSPRRVVHTSPAWGPTDGTFASAYASCRPDAEAAADQCRLLAEACDAVGGIVLTLATGPGDAAGTAAACLEELELECGRITTAAHAALPGYRHPIEAYNTVLCTAALTGQADLVCLSDAAAATRVLATALQDSGSAQPVLASADVDALVGCACAGLTAPLRFPKRSTRGGGVTLDALVGCLAPYPRLHYVTPSLAPLATHNVMAYQSPTPQAVVAAALHPGAALLSTPPASQPRTLASALLWRGSDVPPDQVVAAARAAEAAGRTDAAVDWASGGPCVWAMPTAQPQQLLPPGGLWACPQVSCLALCNSSRWGIGGVRDQLLAAFDDAWATKAFVAKYVAEGMEVAQFNAARGGAAQLADEYEAAAGDTVPPGAEDEGGAPSELG